MRMSEDSIVLWNVELVSHTRTWNRYSIADTKNHFPIFSVRSNTRTFFYPKVRYGREIFSEAPRGLMSFQVLERWKIKTRCIALTCHTACRRRKQGLSPTAKKTIRFALLFEPYGSKFFSSRAFAHRIKNETVSHSPSRRAWRSPVRCLAAPHSFAFGSLLALSVFLLLLFLICFS